MKQILAISLIVFFFIVGSYFVYSKYHDDLELEHYLGGVKERAASLSFILLDKKKKTNNYEKYLKSSILFDLRAINQYDDIGDRLNFEQYCKDLLYIEHDLYDFNISTKKIIHKFCKKHEEEEERKGVITQ